MEYCAPRGPRAPGGQSHGPKSDARSVGDCGTVLQRSGALEVVFEATANGQKVPEWRVVG